MSDDCIGVSVVELTFYCILDLILYILEQVLIAICYSEIKVREKMREKEEKAKAK
jgi:hypothetical protein